MKELLDDIERWRRGGVRIAVARVVDVEGSGPRGPGAAMAVNDLGEVIGSVSGGCVEGAVVTHSLDMLRGERPPGVISFGYSDDEAIAVGLTCGGTVQLFIEEYSPTPSTGDEAIQRRFSEALRSDTPVALATVIDGTTIGAKLLVAADGSRLGSLGDDELDRVAARDASAELAAGRSGLRRYGPRGQTTPEDLDDPAVTVFVESWSPPPQMWIFGAVDFTAALARVAKVLGYRVTVCDARPIFATGRRFPMADDVKVSWPDAVFADRGTELGPRDAVCILTHDPKFDVPAIAGALRTQVGYIGVMGSRQTHARRLERLADAGIDDPAALSRLRSPIGLDLGARTPEETAISICGEIIAQRTGRRATSLSEGSGPIHS